MKYILIVLGLFLTSGLVGCGSGSEDAEKKVAAEQTAPASTTAAEATATTRDAANATPDFISSASDLVAEFTNAAFDTVNSKYEGKVVEVAGALCYIDQTTYADGVSRGPVYVALCESGTYNRNNVRCQFPDGDPMYEFGGLPDRLLIVNGTDTLARGHEVVVRGYYETLGARDFRMEDCQIISY